MMIEARQHYLFVYLATHLFAMMAVLICDLNVSIKITLIIAIVLFGCYSYQQRIHVKAQYLPLSRNWLLHELAETKLAVLQQSSFVSTWCMILNWVRLDGKRRTLILFRWQYDDSSWRHYRLLLMR